MESKSIDEISETSASISVSELHIIAIKTADAFVQNRNTLLAVVENVNVCLELGNSVENGHAASRISSGILDDWIQGGRALNGRVSSHVTTIRALSGHVRSSGHLIASLSRVNAAFFLKKTKEYARIGREDEGISVQMAISIYYWPVWLAVNNCVRIFREQKKRETIASSPPHTAVCC